MELPSLAMTAQSTVTSAQSLLDAFYNVLTRSTSSRPSQGIYTLEIDPSALGADTAGAEISDVKATRTHGLDQRVDDDVVARIDAPSTGCCSTPSTAVGA